MTEKPSEKLNLTKTNLYMIILMLNSIIDEFYDELSHVSYGEMWELMSSQRAFSFFKKYSKNSMVETLIGIYENTPKIDEFNYLMKNMLCLRYPKKFGIEFKGANLLLAACMELQVHFHDYELSYNDEPEREFYWKEIVKDFSMDFKNLAMLIRAEFHRLFKTKLHHQ